MDNASVASGRTDGPTSATGGLPEEGFWLVRAVPQCLLAANPSSEAAR